MNYYILITNQWDMTDLKDLDHYFSSSNITVSDDTYSIIQTTVMYHDSFAIIKIAEDDITLVVKQKDATYHIKSKDIINIDDGWKIITINAELPLDLVGFLAKISQALAEAEISIFAISSFDTDHILVREEKINKAIQILQNLGLSLLE